MMFHGGRRPCTLRIVISKQVACSYEPADSEELQVIGLMTVMIDLPGEALSMEMVFKSGCLAGTVRFFMA